MKKIVLGILLLLTMTIIGCKYDDQYQRSCNASNYSASSFNQEHYVWENIYFPTNRTSGRQ